jgi:hypothetical protein
MQLFTKSSNKTKLQQGLDRDRECQSAGCAVEGAPVKSGQQQQAEFFGKSKKKEIFEVDLLGDWLKP